LWIEAQTRVWPRLAPGIVLELDALGRNSLFQEFNPAASSISVDLPISRSSDLQSLRPDSFSAPNAVIFAAFGVFARTF
jgi:hypothetical protein